MPYFTKKPVEIEAELINNDNIEDLAEWCNGVVTLDGLTLEKSISIYTLEGVMSARVGDYLIRGVNGEFYPCKPDIFAKTYDESCAEQPPLDPNIIEVVSVQDQPDGSAIVNMNIGSDAAKKFIEIGLLKVLKDEARRTLEDEIDTNVGC